MTYREMLMSMAAAMGRTVRAQAEKAGFEFK